MLQSIICSVNNSNNKILIQMSKISVISSTATIQNILFNDIMKLGKVSNQ